VLSVLVALGMALLLGRFQLHNVFLFLFAITVAAWYGKTSGAVPAFLLSFISFAYFFVEPLHRLYLSRSDLCYSLFLPHLQPWSAGSAPFDTASRPNFVELATRSRSDGGTNPAS
jgi:hypothetical protein